MKLQLAITMGLLAVLMAGVSPAPADDQGRQIPEPFLEVEKLKEDTFGDDQNVALLARLLLEEEDPIARAWAVTHLGQTHNPAALPYLRKALADDELLVRVAAVSAAGELGFDQAHQIVIGAFTAKQSETLLAAMRVTRALQLSASAEPVTKLLAADDPLIRAIALKTLAALGTPIDQATLGKLLADTSTHVRLEALAYVLLMKEADQVVARLLAAAKASNPPAVRSRAIEALGKHAMSRSGGIISSAEDSTDPLIRRGVVRAYHNAAKRDRIAPFLDDRSGMVRLAAIEAAGQLRLAQTTSKLMTLMLDAPDSQSHRAARLSLAQLRTPAVADATAAALVTWAETTPAPPPTPAKPAEPGRSQSPAPLSAPRGPTAGQIERNVASCCRLLGKCKSNQAIEYQLALMPKLSTESSILLELVPSLAAIGDRQAIGPLVALLDRCKTRGRRYLLALATGSSPPPYQPQIPRRIIQALAEMKAYDKVDDILDLVNTNVQGLRLDVCASYAVRVLPDLLQDDNRAKIEKFIVTVIGDERFLLTARFYAAKTAAKMKIDAALPVLEDVLTKERPGWDIMRSAGWAIQTVSGKAPDIPQPRTKQGKWVITKIGVR